MRLPERDSLSSGSPPIPAIRAVEHDGWRDGQTVCLDFAWPTRLESRATKQAVCRPVCFQPACALCSVLVPFQSRLSAAIEVPRSSIETGPSRYPCSGRLAGLRVICGGSSSSSSTGNMEKAKHDMIARPKKPIKVGELDMPVNAVVSALRRSFAGGLDRIRWPNLSPSRILGQK